MNETVIKLISTAAAAFKSFENGGRQISVQYAHTPEIIRLVGWQTGCSLLLLSQDYAFTSHSGDKCWRYPVLLLAESHALQMFSSAACWLLAKEARQTAAVGHTSTSPELLDMLHWLPAVTDNQQGHLNILPTNMPTYFNNSRINKKS